jgi:hypothetical protein
MRVLAHGAGGRAAAGFVALLLAAGCATPERRIAANPALFASFPPSAQQLIRQGRIDIGFSPDMVRMALGGPSRLRERVTAEGRTEVWVYTDIFYRSEFAPVQTYYWTRTRRGHPRLVSDYAWVDVQQRHERELLCVEFRDGKVAAMEIGR